MEIRTIDVDLAGNLSRDNGSEVQEFLSAIQGCSMNDLATITINI